MNLRIRSTLLAAGLLVALSATGQTMSGADVRAAKERIEVDHKAARATCDSLAGNAKDICVAEAKGRHKVALAEFEHRRSGKPADMAKVAMARADADYEVAKERCDDMAGNDKDVCIKQAKAAEARAKADAKLTRSTADARGEAADTKRDADYRVALEKCDALAGDAKSSCINAAKSRFGKS